MKDEFALEAEVYDRVWGKHDYETDVKFLDKQFKKHGCRKILDIGCGTGNHSLRLSKLRFEVTGVDISPAMVRIAKRKDKNRKVRFRRGDMRKLKDIVAGNRYNAIISLGQVFSHLYTDKEVPVFLKAVHDMLRENGLFVFSARNAKKISEDYLNKLLLGHMINDKHVQLIMLTHNHRDPQDPNTIVWKPIYLIKKNGKVDLQIREHKLRWSDFENLKRMLIENGFDIAAVYSGPLKERFSEDVHNDMWFITVLK